MQYNLLLSLKSYHNFLVEFITHFMLESHSLYMLGVCIPKIRTPYDQALFGHDPISTLDLADD